MFSHWSVGLRARIGSKNTSGDRAPIAIRKRRRELTRTLLIEDLESRHLMASVPVLNNFNTTPNSAQINDYFALGNNAYYKVINSQTSLTELWKSDGTSAGTNVLKTFAYEGGGRPSDVVTIGSTVYFGANDPVSGNALVYKTDGTAANTIALKPGSYNNAANFQNVNGTLYFFATNTADNSYCLWKSNGTDAGTTIVRLMEANSAGQGALGLATVGSRLYFTWDNGSGQSLWMSDGASATTKIVKSVASNGPIGVGYLRAIGTRVVFAATTASTGSVELWSSDGTTTNTKVVKTFANGGPNFAYGIYSEFSVTGNNLYLSGYDVTLSNYFAYVYSGTTNTVEKLGTTGGGITNPIFYPGGTIGSFNYFAADSIYGRSLWKTDGTTAGTSLVDPTGLSDDPRKLVVVGTTLYYEAYDSLGSSGYELWKTDGTTAGTKLVADIVPGFENSIPDRLMAVGSRLAFTATTATAGTEPWTTDGTAAGTKLVKQFTPSDAGSSFGNSTAILGGLSYFGLYNGQDYRLMKTDGTATGTTVVATGLQDVPTQFIVLNNVLYFRVYNAVWRSDGTTAGTRPLVATGGPILRDNSFVATSVGSVLYFRAWNGVGPDKGAELWRTDGTSAGTRMVRDIVPGSGGSYPGSTQQGEFGFASINNLVVFSGYDPSTGYYDMYRSNGTAAGTTKISSTSSQRIDGFSVIGSNVYYEAYDIADDRYYVNLTNGTTITTLKENGSAPYNFTYTNGINNKLQSLPSSSRVYFIADKDTDYDNRGILWSTTGSYASLSPVFPLGTSQPIAIFGLTSLNGRLWFTAINPLDGQRSVYVSDGTAAGTQVLRTIGNGGPTDASQFTLLNGFVYFAGTTTANGTELWRTDGTTAGTVLVSDILPGSTSSGLVIQGVVGNTLMYAADNGVNGTELFFLPNAPTVVAGLPATALAYEAVSAAGPGSTPLAIAPLATVTDQYTNFSKSVLNVSIAGGDAGDVLAIANQGTAAGQVSVATVGTTINVSFGGVLIGTLTGGTTSLPLKVAFNTAVTQAALQAVVRTLRYSNTLNPPVFTNRIISIGITNGLGAPPVPTTVTVAINSRPIINVGSANVVYQSQGVVVPVAVSSNASLSDANADLNGATFRVLPPANAASSDLLTIRPQSTVGAVLAISGGNVTFNSILIGTVTSGAGIAPLAVTFNAAATIAGVNAVMQNVVYSSTAVSPAPGTLNFLYQFTDAGGLASTSVPVGSVLVNVPTAISGLTPPSSFSVSSGLLVAIAPSAVVNDANGDYANSSLTVTLADNVDLNDILVIPNQGIAAGQIGVTGSSITFGGVVVASFTGGTATTPLRVVFGSTATQEVVQALLRSLQFNNTSASMGIGTRSIQFSITDGNGLIGPTAISQVLINPAPTINGLPTTSTYSVNGSALALAPTATISGATTNFASSSLTVTITNGTTFDRIAVRNVGVAAGQVGVSGANVTFGGVVIGTLSVTTATSPLTITFNASATQAAVQAVLNNTVFSIATGLPTTTGRIVQLRFTDRVGAVSPIVSTTVNINAAPVFTGIVTPLAYNRGTAAIAIAPAGTVSDSGSQYSASTLIVRNTNGEATDTLTLRNVGTAAGQVATFGNAVFVSGVLAGTLTGGTGTTALTIVFVTGTTQATINVVLGNVLFSTASTASTTNRTVSYQLRDTLGAINSSFVQTVVMNQAPVLVGISPTVSYSSVAATPVLLVPATATITNVDGDFANSILAVDLSTTGISGDRLSVRNQGSTAGLVGIVVSGTTTSVTFGGVTVGTLTGGTSVAPLTIQFNSAATSASVTAVLKNLTFVTTTPTPASRTIRFSITDGGGLLSSVVSQSLTIT